MIMDSIAIVKMAVIGGMQDASVSPVKSISGYQTAKTLFTFVKSAKR